MSPDTPAGPAVTILLGLSVLVCVMSSLGLLVMRGFYNKLHYLAPPAILGTAAIAAAVAVQEGMSPSTIKAALIVVVMAITNPILTYAAARAKHVRSMQLEEEETPPGEPALSPPAEKDVPPRPPGEGQG